MNVVATVSLMGQIKEKFRRITDLNTVMKYNKHAISKKLSSSIGALKRIRPFVSMHIAIKIYKGLIKQHFDYCSVVWDGLSSEELQNHAARVINKSVII